MIVLGLVMVGVGVFALSNAVLALPGLEINFGSTIAMVGVLVAFFPVVKMFYITPLTTAITERTTHLEATYTEAENLRAEMGKMKSDYEARLAETEASARAQIQDEIKKAQELRQQLTAQAAAQIEDMKSRASAEINAEKDRVINGLRVSTVNLTLAATEKILGENVDDERNRKLIEEFIENAEVPV